MYSIKLPFILNGCYRNLRVVLKLGDSTAELQKDQCFIHSGNQRIRVPKFINPMALEFVPYFESLSYNVINVFRFLL